MPTGVEQQGVDGRKDCGWVSHWWQTAAMCVWIHVQDPKADVEPSVWAQHLAPADGKTSPCGDATKGWCCRAAFLMY